MASQLDIWNLALAYIGQLPRIADPAEDSVEATYCRQFYPMARDLLLESHAWRFATKRKVLAALTIDTDVNPIDTFAYVYAMPSPCIKPVAIMMPGEVSGSRWSLYMDWLQVGCPTHPEFRRNDFICETLQDGSQVICTDVEDAILIYIDQVTDTSKWTPMFTDAVAWLLASYLAGPITKSPDTMGATAKAAAVQAARAAASDSNARQMDPYTNYVAGSIRARA